MQAKKLGTSHHCVQSRVIYNSTFADEHPFSKNIAKLQIPIQSKLIYEKFFCYLKHYWDWQLSFFTKFAFPLDVNPDAKFKSDLINHPSATNFPEHIEHYLKEELAHDSMVC